MQWSIQCNTYILNMMIFYLTLRVYFFYTFTLQCGEVQKKPSLVLFSVKSLSFAIPTAFENIQRIKKKKEKISTQTHSNQMRSLTFHSTESSQNICIIKEGANSTHAP